METLGPAEWDEESIVVAAFMERVPLSTEELSNLQIPPLRREGVKEFVGLGGRSSVLDRPPLFVWFGDMVNTFW